MTYDHVTLGSIGISQSQSIKSTEESPTNETGVYILRSYILFSKYTFMMTLIAYIFFCTPSFVKIVVRLQTDRCEFGLHVELYELIIYFLTKILHNLQIALFFFQIVRNVNFLKTITINDHPSFKLCDRKVRYR